MFEVLLTMKQQLLANLRFSIYECIFRNTVLLRVSVYGIAYFTSFSIKIPLNSFKYILPAENMLCSSCLLPKNKFAPVNNVKQSW